MSRSIHSTFRYIVAWLLVATLATSSACSEDGGGPSETCWDEVSPGVQGHDENAMHRGQVSLVSEVELGAAPQGRENSITASFTDITTVETSSRAQDTNIGGLACFGLTGSPTQKCRSGFTEPCVVEALEVDNVTVEGLDGGDRQLERTSTGKLSSLDLPDPFLGATPITVKVTGRADQGYFPSYDQTLDPPDELELLEPDPSADRPVGVTDIRFGWTPGDASQDLIILDIASSDESITDRVRCFVLDDGCHTLLPDALEWLEIAQGDTFRMTLTRVRSTVKSLDDNHSIQLSINSRITASLVR